MHNSQPLWGNMLKHKMKFWSVVGLSLLLLSAPASAQEIKENQQKVQYDVYAGGIHALQANLDIDMSKKGRYGVSLWAKTYGLLGKLAPWSGKFESTGWAAAKAGEKNRPELHQSTATWRGEDEIKRYSYGKDGSFKSYSIQDDENDGSPRKVDDALTQGTSDVLAATLNTMQAVAQSGKCEGQEDIFDGKRRFTLIFKQKRDVVLEKSRYNVYEGNAVECTAEVKPAEGEWHEKPRGWMSIQEQGRDKGTMPTVWFAQMAEGQPAVPVKVRVKTSYGTLFMHMTQYQTTDTRLALD